MEPPGTAKCGSAPGGRPFPATSNLLTVYFHFVFWIPYTEPPRTPAIAAGRPPSLLPKRRHRKSRSALNRNKVPESGKRSFAAAIPAENQGFVVNRRTRFVATTGIVNKV